MADERLLRETEEFFYDKIPITRAQTRSAYRS